LESDNFTTEEEDPTGIQPFGPSISRLIPRPGRSVSRSNSAWPSAGIPSICNKPEAVCPLFKCPKFNCCPEAPPKANGFGGGGGGGGGGAGFGSFVFTG